MSADQGQTLTLPIKQAVQKTLRLLEKTTSEARNIMEACQYISVAINIYFLSPELKQYIDLKGTFVKDNFSKSVEEWQATQPQRLDGRKRPNPNKSERSSMRPGSAKKPGTCYFCRKMGHYTKKCRSRLATEKTTQSTNPSQQDKGKRKIT